ncbi:ExbD/TolR family protein [Chamaesiphon sp.]|uniref:ExbD/TolR family protein n=1 Tax=Chamaesiphon sp. TaxID=2814140 RepID=UPI003592FDD1
MRLSTESEDRPPEINVVALIDVIFAILTFFIVTSLSLSKTEGLAVDLPKASSGKIQDQTKVVININAQGAIALNRKSIDPTNLVSEIKSLIVKDQPTMVVINADEKVGHGRVVAMMDLVQQIPGIKLGIATKRK